MYGRKTQVLLVVLFVLGSALAFGAGRASASGQCYYGADGGVYAGKNTTCAFAMNVANAWSSTWNATDRNSFVVFAYSPALKRSLRMRCVGEPLRTQIEATCRGGHGARVDLWNSYA